MAHDNDDIPGRRLTVVQTPPEGLPPVPAAPDGSVLSAGNELVPDGITTAAERGEPVEGHLIERTRTRRDWFATLDSDEPVIPSWFTDKQVRQEIRNRWLRRAGRASLVAAINGPWWALCLVGWTFRGGFRTTKRVGRWAADREGHPVSGAQAASTDKVYEQAAWRHAETIGFRVRLLAFLALVAVVAAGVGYLLTVLGWLPGWLFWGLSTAGAVTSVVVLARAGRPEKVKTLTPFARKFIVPTITCLLVSRALREVVPSNTAKLIVEAEEKNALWGSGFIPIPGGHKIQVILPGSHTARSLVPYEDRIASGLGRPEDCAIVVPLPKVTAGHFDLYIFDAPVFDGRSQAGPIATMKRSNWWSPMPCGITRTREVHKERLWGGAWGVGGKPEHGKSELGKAIVAWAILDPSVKPIVCNLKGDGGYLFAKASCHQYISASPDLDHTAIAKVHRVIRWLLEEAGRRNAFMTRLQEQGKTTECDVNEELARRYPNELGPILCLIDELHRALNESDYSEADTLKADLSKAVKAVRSAGITIVWLTQLANSESVPTDVTGATRCRTCLRVDGTAAFSQVYGQAGEGVFKQLGIGQFPAGVAVMSSQEGRPVKIKLYRVSPKLAELGKRAHRLRTDLDLLSGEAAGQTVATGSITDPADLLRHLLPVIGSSAPSDDAGTAWLSELETVLTERDEYRGRADGWLADELKARRVRTGKVNRRVPADEDRPSGQRSENGVTVQAVRDRLAELLDVVAS